MHVRVSDRVGLKPQHSTGERLFRPAWSALTSPLTRPGFTSYVQPLGHFLSPTRHLCPAHVKKGFLRRALSVQRPRYRHRGEVMRTYKWAKTCTDERDSVLSAVIVGKIRRLHHFKCLMLFPGGLLTMLGICPAFFL